MALTLTTTQICNMAISHAGGQRLINDVELENATSPEAAQCTLWYDVSRIEMLEGFDWSFARKYFTMPKHADTEPTGWGFRYIKPVDMVVARFIAQPLWWQQDPIPFATLPSIDGTEDTICTDHDDAELIYSFDQTNSDRFSRIFATTLSYLLATKMTFSTTGKQTKQKNNADFFNFYLLNAMNQDWNKARRPKAREAEWVRDRGVGVSTRKSFAITTG